MSRRVLAAPFALILLAAPALAQTAGAPGTADTHPRALPGTAGVTAVPDTGQQTDSGSSQGAAINTPDSGTSGPRSALSPTGTGPMQGGGGPDGPGSAVQGQRSDAVQGASSIMLAQADIQAQSPGIAQEPGAAPPPPPPAPGGNARMGDSRVEQQLRDLYARLRITPAQQPQWNAFAGTLQGNAQHMQSLWASRQNGRVTALDDMRSYATIAQAHAEDMQRLVAAFTPLYESLAPQQKVAADQAFQQAAVRNGRPGSR